MGLYQTILSDLKQAMLNKEQERLLVLRSLKAALLEKEIAERKGERVDLSEEQVTQVLQKAAKQRKDSIDQFAAAGRTDLVDKEKMELQIIASYLPQQMGEDELSPIIEAKIQALGASGPQDIGKVMGVLMSELRGKADGSLINKIVKQKLQP